ncbi:MAG TPA: hypothetical protein VGB03_04615, partial [Acidimicrobiales bacterium]
PRGISSYIPNPYAFDEKRGRLYLVVYLSRADNESGVNPQMMVLDSSTLEVVDRRPFDAFPARTVVLGLSYDEQTNTVQALGYIAADGSNIVGNYAAMVNELDGDSLQPRLAAAFVVPGCQKPVGGNRRQAAVARTPTLGKVFIGCGTGSLVLGSQPGSPFVVEIDLANPADIRTRTFGIAGSYAGGETLADPANERFIMVASTPGAKVQAAWVFDERHGVVVGVVDAGDRNIHTVGLDPAGGRLYVGIDRRVLVGSHLGLKIPQALEVPEPDVASHVGIVPVPYARKVLVPVTTFGANGLATRRLKAYSVTRPDYRPPPPPDPDAGTEDVEEGPATTADYAADAQAIGVRVTHVGGVDAIPQNVAQSPVGPTYWGSLMTNLARAGLPADLSLNDGTRALDFARVSKAHLSQAEAAAKAISVDRDADTAQDYETLMSNGPATPWPYKAGQCSDFGGTNANTAGDDAVATCDQAGGKVEAASTYDESVPLGVGSSFGSASSRTTARRDKARGLVTTSTATVDNLVVAPGVSIGRITSTAEAAAAGRKGKAAGSYKRVFENVRIGTFSCTVDCKPEEVVDRINGVPGLTVRAELPLAEAGGSPGGARATAIREPWQH